MEPKKVNPKNFKVEAILYEDGEFSVAYGLWSKNKKRIGLRWNGTNEDIGYPKIFGNPMWFMLSEKLTTSFLKSLIDNPNANNPSIIQILSSL